MSMTGMPPDGALAHAYGSLPEPKVIGNSAVFQRLLNLIDMVAPTKRPLLISGPSGSGKEVVAQLLHCRGSVPQAPFVDINCGALPEHLVEAELFGHVKGAFTGAVHTRPGHFELAGKGTLFLDEIGELPMALQPKLLRVLETGTYRPVGSSQLRRFEGRIVAATHCDLQAMVQAGTFREDLYYRLAVFVLDVPGLEQRRDDIPALIAHFASRQPRRLTFTPAAVDRLTRHSWPGQVRELRNVVDRLAILSQSATITPAELDDFLPPARSAAPPPMALAEALMLLEGDDKLAAAEQLLIDHALRQSGGNKTAAARLLGVNRKAVERRVTAREDRSREAQSCLDEGKLLVDNADFKSAIVVLQRGLERLAGAPAPEQHRRLRFELYRLLVVSHRSVHGWLSTDARACYKNALAEARELGDEIELTSLLFGIWSTQLMALELVGARATAQEMLRRAQALNNAEVLAQAYLALSNTLYWLGDSQEALACLVRGDLVADQARPPAGSQGFDVVGLALTLEGLSAFQLGQFGRARTAWQRLIARGGADNPHPFNRVIALQGAAWLASLFEDMEQLGPLARDLESISTQHGFIFYRGIGQVFRGWHLVSNKGYEEAEAAMAEGYEQHMLCQGGKLFHSFQAWKRGELLLQAGRAAECDALISQALDMALEHQDRAYLSELLEVRARARSALGDIAGAERELRSALSTALALGAATARVGVATELAQLLAQSGKRDEALRMLTRAVQGVEADPTVPRFARATRLLDELGQADISAVPT